MTSGPPQTEAYQLEMVVPSLISCVFLPRLLNDVTRPWRLEAFWMSVLICWTYVSRFLKADCTLLGAVLMTASAFCTLERSPL